jgi:phage baseplate assembly protein W
VVSVTWEASLADVFVSYSRRDADFVAKVVGQLNTAGISVWIDTDDIDAGDQWKTAITQAIDQAKWCTLVLSPRSMESSQVAAEVNMAFDKKRPIIPILFEETEINSDLSYALAGINYVDFTGSFDDGMTGLLRAFGAAEPGRRFANTVLDENVSEARTVGRGLGFPLRVDTRGGIATTDRGAAIDDSLLMIVLTIPGERVGRPEFGCDIWDLAFERFSTANLSAMSDRIRDAVHRWEPRAESVSVQVDAPHIWNVLRQIHVTIAYTVRGADERRELTTGLALA